MYCHFGYGAKLRIPKTELNIFSSFVCGFMSMDECRLRTALADLDTIGSSTRCLNAEVKLDGDLTSAHGGYRAGFDRRRLI